MNRQAAQGPSSSVALVADDDEFFRMAAVAILKTRLGFAGTIEATSLDDALTLARDHAGSTTLALLDLRMPGVESMASLTRVRLAYPNARLVVVSASRKRSDVMSALDIGAHGYVWKAAGVGELERSLTAVLDGQISIPSFVVELQNDPPPLREPAKGSVLDHLTGRQRDVLRLLVEGASNKHIARQLGLGEGTVKIHVAGILRALGVPNRAAAAVAGAAVIRNDRSA